MKNPYWDPATDPARTQYPDEYDFKSQVPTEKIDQILLADSGTGQTTLTYDDLLAPDYQKMKTQSPERLTLGGQPCTYYWAPDNRKITDKKVRRLCSGPTRTRTTSWRGASSRVSPRFLPAS